MRPSTTLRNAVAPLYDLSLRYLETLGAPVGENARPSLAPKIAVTHPYEKKAEEPTRADAHPSFTLKNAIARPTIS